jgi:ABC-2 type transport system permease protein
MKIKRPAAGLRHGPSRARLRHGGYAAGITVLVLLALVLANLVAARLPLKLDLSSYKMYSISEQSLGFLKGLKEDMDIYGLFKPGQEPANVVEVLNRYRDASPRIHLEFFDVERNPAFAKKYDSTGRGLAPGSLVVVARSSGRFRVIPYEDLYEVAYDQRSGQQQVRGVAVEQRVTGALSYAAGGRIASLYELSGHSEFSLEEIGLAPDLAKENGELHPLNLLAAKEVPKDADLVLVISPKSDLLPGEAEALKRYLDSGGNALFLIDRMKAPLAGLESVINLYGVATTQGYVLEGDESRMAAGRPNLLIPELLSHEILASIKDKKYLVTILNSQALRESSAKRQYLKLTPLLASSPSSWLRTDLGSDSATRIASDRLGSQVLAYAVEAPKSDPKARPSRIVVAGSSVFAIPSIMKQYMGPGNDELFLNMASWCENRDEGLNIRPKSTIQMALRLSAAQSFLWLGLVVILIPGLILAAGLVVWLRRRRL